MKLFIAVLFIVFACPVLAVERKESSTARFAWLSEGFEPNEITRYLLQCGNRSGTYPNGVFLGATVNSYPVLNVVSRSGTYYCLVVALSGSMQLEQSNEIVIDLRGKWVTQTQ